MFYAQVMMLPMSPMPMPVGGWYPKVGGNLGNALPPGELTAQQKRGLCMFVCLAV